MRFSTHLVVAPLLLSLSPGCATFTGGGPAFDPVRAAAVQQARVDGGCGELEVSEERDLRDEQTSDGRGQSGTFVVAGCGKTWEYLSLCAQTTAGSDCKAISTTPPPDPFIKNREAAVAEAEKAGCSTATTEAELVEPKTIEQNGEVGTAAVVVVTGCGSTWRVNTMCGPMKDGPGCMAFAASDGDAPGDAPADDLKVDIDTDLGIDPDTLTVD